LLHQGGEERSQNGWKARLTLYKRFVCRKILSLCAPDIFQPPLSEAGKAEHLDILLIVEHLQAKISAKVSCFLGFLAKEIPRKPLMENYAYKISHFKVKVKN